MRDFPAAHSMDSGWFAVDENGMLAHFDTSEDGALPVEAKYATGNADGDGEELWMWHVAPWIARNTPAQAYAEAWCALALFDSEARARDALAALASCDPTAQENPLLISVALHEGGFDLVQQQPGFVGFSPELYDLYDAFDEVLPLVPLAQYRHGLYGQPGEYVRYSLGASVNLPDLPADLTTMNVDFTTAEDLHLADFYDDSECYRWEVEVGLRGERLPTTPEQKRDWLDRITRFFKG